MLAERGREVSDKLSVMANPFAVAVGPDGTMLARMAAHLDKLAGR